MPVDLTDVNVVSELLKRAVAEKGADYIYPGAGEKCYYFEPDGTPSCIVGHVLYYLGAKAEDSWSDDWNEDTDVSSLRYRGIVEMTTDTMNLLRQAQMTQDSGISWGESIERAGVK
jgi:hypothetical protein